MRRYYTPREDKNTVIMWLVFGGVASSLVTGNIIFLFIVLMFTYGFYRCLDNIESGRPAWSPGKYSRHLHDSIERLDKPYLNKSYRIKTNKSRYY